MPVLFYFWYTLFLQKIMPKQRIAPEQPKTEKVLMLVKAYPELSTKYGETVCTAGIRLRDMTWVRIYPYPFRLVDKHYRFAKWDIIEVPLVRSIRDPRPDSYKLYDVAQIQQIDHVETDDKTWTPRMKYIIDTAMPSVRVLLENALPQSGWGASILPVAVEQKSAQLSWEADGQWSEEQLRKLEAARRKAESNLFNPIKYAPLNPRPYFFRLTFRDLEGAQYTYPILDWEIYQLYFNSRESSNSDEEALEKVRLKIEDQIFAANRQTYIILGSIHQRFRKPQLFAVDGFIWPLRQEQPSLF